MTLVLLYLLNKVNLLTWKEFLELKLMVTKTDLTRKFFFFFNIIIKIIYIIIIILINRYANSKKILEINPSHPAIKEILERVKDDVDRETEELARVLYEGALVNSGKI